MINWFNMPTEGLSNGGQFEIKELTATENKVYQKDGEVYNKVTVNVEGGGGGDFSTAEVTITNTAENSYIYLTYGAFVEDGELFTEYSVATGTSTATLVLYKGSQLILISADSITSTTGDITGDLIDGFTITGDCTITGEGFADS